MVRMDGQKVIAEDTMESNITHILKGLKILQRHDPNGYGYTDGQTIVVVSDTENLTEKEKEGLQGNNWSEGSAGEWYIHL